VGLEIYQNQGDLFIKQGHLVWSKDSQRVAISNRIVAAGARRFIFE
jgi:hypothetical protein